jgi:hypothetical protein
VPDQLGIPPIEPAFVEEIKQLTEESTEALRLVTNLALRVNQVMFSYEALTGDLDTDQEVAAIRDATDYPGLLNVWFALAGQAAAAADHPTDLPLPPWYRHLLELRGRRLHQQEMAGS